MRLPRSCSDHNAGITAKPGFSVVAPMRISRPDSICGSRTSCWALLKRWISSEEDGPLPMVAQAIVRSRQDDLEFADSCLDRRHRLEGCAGCSAPAVERAWFCPPERTPQHHGWDGLRRHQAADQSIIAEQVALTDHLAEVAGSSARLRG